jgi:hypothetical protein
METNRIVCYLEDETIYEKKGDGQHVGENR